jgi:hypothetical protein
VQGEALLDLLGRCINEILIFGPIVESTFDIEETGVARCHQDNVEPATPIERVCIKSG